MLSHCDSAFAIWNTLISPKEQAQYNVERESIVDESEQTCYMVQGNDSLEINSKSHLDDCVSSSNDHDSMKAQVLNEELSIFCENLPSKYILLKSKRFESKEENKNLFSNFDKVL